MLKILSLTAPFFSLIFLGLAAGRFLKLPVDGLAWLNVFVVYLAIPALLFKLLSQTPIDQLANWGFIFSTTFASYVAFAIAFAIGIFVSGGDIKVSTIQGLGGAYGNVGFMAPGLALAALGPESVVPTALIFCFDNTLFFTIAPLMMALASDDGQSIGKTLILILKRIFTHPFILATIAGVLAAAIELDLPDAGDRLIDLLAAAGAPCALFALGVSLALRPIKRVPYELPGLMLVKLIIQPILVVLILLWVGGIPPVWIATAMLVASLPPATNVFVIAQQYQTYVDRASAVVLLGTITSVVTVSFVLYLIETDLLGLGVSLQ